MFARVTCAICLLLTGFSCVAATQRALLIGISNYSANLPSLPGATNDVRLINDLLIHKYGFDQSNVEVIVDQQATRSRIFDALASLARRAGPNDIVLIHYSGHGSRVPDTDGDEEDGQDETILPYDARTDDVPDITDDELNALIGKLRSQSVIVVLDSCHSGTGTRSGPRAVTQRWVTPDKRLDLYRTSTRRQVIALPITEDHVFFAAAQETESELDGPFGPNNMPLGLLTAALVGTLVRSPTDVTPLQAIHGISTQIEGLKAYAAGMPIPEPNMEAPISKHRRPMFVLAGQVAQEQSGSASMIMPTGTPPAFAENLSTIFATRNGIPDSELAHQIVTSIGSGIRAVGEIDDADVVIDALDANTFTVYGPRGTVQVATSIARTKQSLRVASPSSTADFRFLEKIIRNAPAIATLLSINNFSTATRLQMTAAGNPSVDSRSISSRTIKVSANTDDYALQYYIPGDVRTRRNSLQLELISNRNCYLTIASANSQGDIALLLPNDGQEATGFLKQGLLTANSPHLIPDSLSDSNAAGFHFDYSPPGGIDRVLGFCFIDLAAAERFRAWIRELESGNWRANRDLGPRGLTNVVPTPSQSPGSPNPTIPTEGNPANNKATLPASQSSGLENLIGSSGDWGIARLTLAVGPN